MTWTWFHRLASPPYVYGLAARLTPWFAWPAALLIGAGDTAAVRSCEPPLVTVPARGVSQYRRASAAALSFAAEATIPLGGFSARFVVFRDGGGGTILRGGVAGVSKASGIRSG